MRKTMLPLLVLLRLVLLETEKYFWHRRCVAKGLRQGSWGEEDDG